MSDYIKDIKVLHLLPIYLPNSQVWLYNQITSTPNVKAYVAAHKYIPNMFKSADIEFVKSPLQGLSGMLSKMISKATYKSTIQSRVSAREFDIIHAHFSIIGYEFLHLAKYAPLVTSFYGFDYERLPYTNPEWLQRYKELFRLGKLFLCEGEHGKKTLIKMGCPEEKIRVNPLGIRGSFIEQIPRHKEKDELILLQAAPFREKKGQKYTIQAFAKALKYCPNMHLTFVGDDIEGGWDEIFFFIRELGIGDHVDMHDGVVYKKLIDSFKKYQVFIHPSCYSESMDCEGGAPMVLLDAQATGMPVISTNHCDIPAEVIDGKTGYLTPEKDITALAESIMKFYKMNNDEYQKMSLAAHKHVSDNFRSEDSGKRLTEIYKSLLN